MSAFMVNTSVMTKVVTAILLNRDTFDGESTCRAALLAAPTDPQKEAGTKIGSLTPYNLALQICGSGGFLFSSVLAQTRRRIASSSRFALARRSRSD
jgi:hypothetical protein